MLSSHLQMTRLDVNSVLSVSKVLGDEPEFSGEKAVSVRNRAVMLHFAERLTKASRKRPESQHICLASMHRSHKYLVRSHRISATYVTVFLHVPSNLAVKCGLTIKSHLARLV